MTFNPSAGRSAIIALTALATAILAGPATAYIAPYGTYSENFEGFSNGFYIENALPDAYVIDGYVKKFCTTGCNGFLSSYNGFDAVQIDFDHAQDYVSFTNASLFGQVTAHAFSYAYGPASPVWLDHLTDVATGTSHGVLTLRSPIPADPDLYRPLIRTIVFVNVPGGGQWGIDDLTWSSSAPEPEAWALILAGFGATGAVLRRGRRRSTRSLPV